MPKKIKAEFVVVHTNEIYHGEVAAVKELVYQRLAEVISLAQSYGVQVVIENVGLRPCGSLLLILKNIWHCLNVIRRLWHFWIRGTCPR